MMGATEKVSYLIQVDHGEGWEIESIAPDLELAVDEYDFLAFRYEDTKVRLVREVSYVYRHVLNPHAGLTPDDGEGSVEA